MRILRLCNWTPTTDLSACQNSRMQLWITTFSLESGRAFPLPVSRAWNLLRLLLSALGGVIVESINTLASHQISAALFEGDGRCSFIKQTKQ